MDSNQDNRVLIRADSNYSVNSIVFQDFRDYKILRFSKFKCLKFKINVINLQIVNEFNMYQLRC